jgi:heat shock protein HtpX
MHRNEVDAVLGHEIAHVANGDMVTLTLIQGVVNTFVIFFARIIGGAIDKAVFGNKDGRGMGYFVSVMVTEMVLGILASIIVLWFSRQREFRADTGGAFLPAPSRCRRRWRHSASRAVLPVSVRCLPATRRWRSGLPRCDPAPQHRNTYISLWNLWTFLQKLVAETRYS